MSFQVAEPVDVIVAFDSRCTELPQWLADWKRMGGALRPRISTGCQLKFLKKSFMPGKIELGGCAAPGVGAMYSVIVIKKEKSSE
jgi:hypothetical protein